MTERRRRWICESGQRSNLSVRSWTVTAIALSSLLGACAPISKKDDVLRVRQLERNLKRQQQIIENLKERNWVLETRVKSEVSSLSNKPASKALATTVTKATAPTAAATAAPTAAPTAAKAAASVAVKNSVTVEAARKLPTELPPKFARPQEASAEMPTGEHLLYSKILETYRSRNLAEMEKTIQLLVKTYPESAFGDNSFYMAGLLAGELGLMPRAYQLLDRVVTDYPRGNKVVSALFAKSMFLRREAKWNEARRNLNEVARRFPGSPEALRVGLELKLLDLERKRHSQAAKNGQGA